MTLLKQENCFLLRRFISIVESVTDSQYLLSDQPLFKSSIGAHVRHVLDHYQALINALSDGSLSGHVNYDERTRDESVEINRSVAIDRLNAMITLVEQINDYDVSLIVSMDVGSPDAVGVIPQRSTVGRELTFLHSHHIHHEALIAFILRVLNITSIDNEIGLAPSTLKHTIKQRKL